MRNTNAFCRFYLYAVLLTSLGCQHVPQTHKEPIKVLTDAKRREIKEILIKIYDDDQEYRSQAMLAINQYGIRSERVRDLAKKINNVDSINIPIVKSIIKKYGWLGSKDIGEKANSALYLVIQHAQKEDRAFFLPIMRNAAKNNSAGNKDLASLEDRVALDQGGQQIYGTQLGLNEKTKKYYLFPLKDPENVDLRRSRMGMIPIREYLRQWANGSVT